LVDKDHWLSSAQRNSTTVGNIFVAGDFALGATTLIQAIGHARECARAVDHMLMGKVRMRESVRIEPVGYSKRSPVSTTGRAAAMNYIPLHPMPAQPVTQRKLSTEVETGYDADVGAQAAGRCYLCHYKFEIIDSKCVLCDECIKVKPVPGCIVEIAQLLRDDEGRITGYEPVHPEKTDSLYYNRLWIDQNQCIRCGECESVCPVNAITIQRVTPAVTQHV
jgi:ferredoxin